MRNCQPASALCERWLLRAYSPRSGLWLWWNTHVDDICRIATDEVNHVLEANIVLLGNGLGRVKSDVRGKYHSVQPQEAASALQG